jgi:heme/copper-type cytochrome/quinol oxidase subunit 2
MNKTYLKTLIILCVLVLVFFSTTVYFFTKYRSVTSGPEQTAQDEVTRIVKEVSKLIVLPADETPTLATVSDPSLLSNQPSFRDAKKGDKVLIYQGAQKAILYDPVAKKVLNIIRLNINDPAPVVPQVDSSEAVQ